MNFLQLCQRVFIEAGISGQITTTQNQNGEALRVVGWVQTAYQELCTEDPTRWWFLRDRRSVELPVVGQSEYTPAEMGIDDLFTYDTSTFRVSVDPGFADETYVFGRRWPDFRDYWRFSSRREVIARPLEVSVTPNMNLAFGPLPDRQYHVQFEYVKKAPPLSKDDDVPLVPPEYQMAIVWLALRHYGMFESAPEVVMRADAQYNEIVTRMFVTQTDEIVIGGALC
jgi:hypothetical protein